MKTAVMFSGQGAQTPGMMKDIYENSQAGKRVFETASEALGRDIAKLCFEGTQEELNLTHNTQPCMLAADLASYAALSEAGIMANLFAGFSLGEYAALAADGVLNTAGVFRIIQLRADAMQEAVPVGQGAMAALMKASQEAVQNLCKQADGYVIPANYNSPDQIVVSGENDAVDAVLALAKEGKIRAVKLPVSAPFHCRLMEPAREALEKAFAGLNFSDGKLPIYMNVDGNSHIEANDISAAVLKQTVSPVQWVRTINNMYEDGTRVFIECGPGGTLSKFVKKILKDKEGVKIYQIEHFGDIEALKRNSTNE